MTTIYVTKYALTSGSFKVEATLKEGGAMAVSKDGCYPSYWHRNEFWLTQDEAIADCENRRVAKLKSLQKQKEKIQTMKFEFKELNSN